MLSCKDVTHLVSESRDRRLQPMERLGMRMHLWICGRCRMFTRQMRLLGQAWQRAEQQPENLCSADVQLSDEASERIRAKLRERRDRK